MLEIQYGIKPFIHSLSQLFQDAPGWGSRHYRLKDQGRFNPALRAVAYGLGLKWSMRYVTDDVDLYVFVALDQLNNGAASISCKRVNELPVQWKFTLPYSPKHAEQGSEIKQDFLSWLFSLASNKQLDVFSEATHQQALSKYMSWDPKLPSITLDMRTHLKDQPEWFETNLASTARQKKKPKQDTTEAVDQNKTSDARDIAISFRYKSPENLGYCVIVFDVSSQTRNDRYAVSLKAPSFLLTNFVALYKRGLFGKGMRLIGEEHKSKTSTPGNIALSHLLEFTRLNRARTQAVCVTQPQSLGVMDTSIKPGQVFDVKSIDKNMDESEFITIHVNGADVQRNANNFIIFGRP